MADHVLFIGWGTPVPGREERAVDVFNEAVGLFGRMLQDGRIEGFDVVLLDPHGGLSGYMELTGGVTQVFDVREDDEFRAVIADAGMVVNDLRVVLGYCHEGVARQMSVFQEAASKVGQRV